MMFYRCKCGDSQSTGSMPPDQCDWCDKCDSSLASHPDGHRPRVPHDFVAKPISTDQGPATISRCRFCGLTAEEILKRKQPQS